ncbi:50S ribosomal protein L17 [Candidatus Jorgensenbacteria bacterium RIFCSPLOWO2_12_FULL_42_11]|uniref:50S ribosomal protein L17 n=1 Tax=Candidatus Jorgensenbacteria bacterium RIFCSPLOWO2_12_FULL_42_11 TaxID=1798473 RepID=A0A1F6C439_9BACT|nr:MAG: 50S ribosomal protein L17 [Candidatus Jorgensenbacteria bacterium RIFCSPLOWO2_12_FULL_42_11]
MIDKAFLKILANNLILREKIETTESRAKALRPFVERLVSYGKKQNLAAYRLLLKKMTQVASDKVYYELAPRYKERPGGYLRIIKHSLTRKNDGAKLVTVEFVK